MNISELITKKYRYVATGNTYPHREYLTSWGWYYDSNRRAWIEENGSDSDEPCIEMIRAIPGVTVTSEEME